MLTLGTQPGGGKQGTRAPPHGWIHLLNPRVLCLLGCLRWHGGCPWGRCRPQGPVCASGGWHRSPGEGDSPTHLGKAVTMVLPGLARLEQPQVRAQESRNKLGTKCTILSGINPVLWIWPVCRCVQWDQHWQGCLQDLKCFSLPGKGHGADGLCLPSVGGSREQPWLCGRGWGFPTSLH